MDRLTAYSPMAISFLVAGLLMFGVYAIVRSVAAPSAVNAGESLEAFQNDVAGVLAQQPIELPAYTQAELAPGLPADAEWMTTINQSGVWWVYVGAWVNCQFVDRITLTYAASKEDPALTTWGQLAPRKQDAAAELCEDLNSKQIAAMLPTVAPVMLPTLAVATPIPAVGSRLVTHVKVDAPNDDKSVLLSGTHEWIPCGRLTNTLQWAGPDGPARAVWESLTVEEKAGAVTACIGG